MGTVLLVATVALLAIAALITAASIKARRRKSLHSAATIIRFAQKAAAEVLSSHWDLAEYYSRLYVYASPELASHMQSNKNLLARVLDERKELLGDFVEARDFELKKKSFSLIPSQVFEITGTLHCKNGQVPITVLVNAGQELTLDGIKLDKGSLKPA